MQIHRGNGQYNKEVVPPIKTLPNSYIGDSKRYDDEKNPESENEYFNFQNFKSNMADIEMISNLG